MREIFILIKLNQQVKTDDNNIDYLVVCNLYLWLKTFASLNCITRERFCIVEQKSQINALTSMV